MAKKNDVKFLGILILLLVGIKIYIFYKFYLDWDKIFLSADDAVYAELARRIYQGNWWTGIHPIWNSGFPILTIPFYVIVHSWEKAQILVSVISSLVLAILIFKFLKRFSPLVAFITSTIAIFSLGFHNVVLFLGISEPAYILFLWISISLAWMAMSTKRVKYYLLSGIFFALTYLIRTDVMAILAIVSIFLAIDLLISKLKFWSLTLRLAIFTIAFILINLPYFMVLTVKMDKITISGKYAFIAAPAPFALDKERNTTFMQDVDSLDNPNYFSPYFDSEIVRKKIIESYTKGSGMYFTKKNFRQNLIFFSTENSDYFFSGSGRWLAVIGLVSGLILAKYRKFTFFLTLIWLVETLWVAAFMGPLERYLTFSLPYLFFLQGLGIYTLAKIVSYLFKKTGSKKLAFFVVIFLLLANYARDNKMIDYVFKQPKPISRWQVNKEVGDWIKSNNVKTIAARHEAFGFYGEAKTIYIPVGTPNEIVEYLRSWNVEYLLIRPDDAGYDFVRPITKPNYKNPNLKLVKIFSDETIAWKVKPLQPTK